MISEARNKSNMSKMDKRHHLLDELINETLTKIKTFAKSDNTKYKELLRQLIVQSMIKLLEDTCLVRVRKSDVEMVKKILPECEREYSEYLKKASGQDYSCTLIIDEINLQNE
jgi:V-type H+-transporting ATPase subunit E